jgi:hypothetical protein
MIEITSLGLNSGLTVTTTGLANVIADTPVASTFLPSVLDTTSTGLYSGLKVTSTGLFFVTPDDPVSSDFDILIGTLTSVSLYGGLNVSTTGLYSQETFSPTTGVFGSLEAIESQDTLSIVGTVTSITINNINSNFFVFF